MNIEELTLKDMLKLLTLKQLFVVFTLLSSLLGAVYFFCTKLIESEYEIQLLEKQKELLEKQKQLDIYDIKWSGIKPYLSKDGFKYAIDGHLKHQNDRNFPKDSEEIDNEFVVGKKILGLSYSKTNRLQHEKEISFSKNYHCFNRLSNLAPLHIWKGDKVYELNENPLYKKIFPYISVQKILKNRLSNKLLSFFECLTPKISSKRNDHRIIDRLVRITSDMHRRDLIGLYLSVRQLYHLTLTLAHPEVIWKATDVQLIGEYLISRSIYTHKNVKLTIDNESEISPEFYIRSDFILVNASQYIYFIEIISPSTKLTGDTAFLSLVNEWLTGFWMIDD